MLLNTYAILDCFICLLRLLLGLLVIALAATAWLRSGQLASPEDRKPLEERNYLLSLLALLLLGLNLVSWPLLYLLLQSYVAEFPGAMCIYGVTQVGSESTGVARFLPRLVAVLQTLKPLLVFGTGAWFVLYLLDRRTETGPLLGRLFLALVVCGTLTVADAGTELAYLSIPKAEETVSTGCCAGAFEAPSSLWGRLTEAVGTPEARPWLYAAYYATNLFMVAGLFLATRRPGSATGLWLVPLLVGACASFLASAVFLVEVAAPAVLHLPYHHCPYDLIPRAPEVLAAVALFLWGTFSVGWACVAGWLGRSPQTAPFLAETAGHILFMGFSCYLGSLAMMSIELALV